jgi:hypothetical protein
MLNPVTLTSYDVEGKLEPQNLFSPVFLAGLWAFSLGGLFIISKRFS